MSVVRGGEERTVCREFRSFANCDAANGFSSISFTLVGAVITRVASEVASGESGVRAGVRIPAHFAVPSIESTINGFSTFLFIFLVVRRFDGVCRRRSGVFISFRNFVSREKE